MAPAATASRPAPHHASPAHSTSTKAKSAKKSSAETKPSKSKKKAKESGRRSFLGIPLATRAKTPKEQTKSHKTAKAPKGATGRCMDGSYTTAKRQKKACSKHGGVSGWLVPDIPPE
jgi:hypothetical protein